MNSELYTMPIEYYRSLAHKGKKGMKWGYNDGKKNGKRTAQGEEEKDYESEIDPESTGRTPEEQLAWEKEVDEAAEYGWFSEKEAKVVKQMSEDEYRSFMLGELDEYMKKLHDEQRAYELNRTNTRYGKKRMDRGH